jgi:hypothetical protein
MPKKEKTESIIKRIENKDMGHCIKKASKNSNRILDTKKNMH